MAHQSLIQTLVTQGVKGLALVAVCGVRRTCDLTLLHVRRDVVNMEKTMQWTSNSVGHFQLPANFVKYYAEILLPVRIDALKLPASDAIVMITEVRSRACYHERHRRLVHNNPPVRAKNLNTRCQNLQH